MKSKKASNKRTKKHLIRALKYILRTIVYLLLGCYTLLQTLTAIPPVQRWAGQVVSSVLEDKINSKVRIESVKLGIMGRVILDGVEVYDQQDTLMLDVSRLAAKMDFAYLLNKKVRINNAQLIGARIRIYQPSEQEPLNIKYLIDAFASKDSTSSPIDLSIGSVLIRRSNLSFHRLYAPVTPERFSPDHIQLNDLSLTAKLSTLTPDTLSARIKKLSFQEESGFCLSKLGFELNMGRTSATLSHFNLQLPNTEVLIPRLTATYPLRQSSTSLSEWLEQLEAQVELAADITPSDASAFVPELKKLNENVELYLTSTLSHGVVQLTDIRLSDKTDSIHLEASSRVENVFKNPYIFAKIDRFSSRRAIELLPKGYRELDIFGNITYGDKNLTAELTAQTQEGEVSVNGSLTDLSHFKADITLTDVNLASIVRKPVGLGRMNMNAEVEGDLPKQDNPLVLNAEGTIGELTFKDYPYRDVPFSLSVRDKEYDVYLSLQDENGNLTVAAEAIQGVKPKWTVNAFVDMEDFAPNALNLTRKYEGDRFSGSLEADFTLNDLNTLNGSLNIRDFALQDSAGNTLQPGDITFISQSSEQGQRYDLESPFLSLSADGRFRIEKLFTSIDSIDALRFTCKVRDTILLRKLAGVELRIPEEAVVRGEMDETNRRMSITAHLPYFEFGKNKVRGTNLNILSNSDILQASLRTEMLTKNKPIKADINLAGRLTKDSSGRKGMQVRVNNSTVAINDTTWKITPAFINYHDSVVDIRDFRIASDNRFLAVEGRISRHETDTLRAELHDLSIGYIMDIVNLHSVEFDGKASGKAFARSVMKDIKADINLFVNNFTFNSGIMGDMDLKGSYGYNDKAIMLYADIKDTDAKQRTLINGSITPGRGPGTGLDLNIETERINLYFLNKYTSGIFTDFQGRATGWARVFGPFKTINIEGRLKLDRASMLVDVLDTGFWLEGDSVIMEPDNIWIPEATVHDRYGALGRSDHSGQLKAHLMHQHLGQLRYDITATPRNMLCYNTTAKSGEDFYGTVFASGNVHLTGEPGTLTVDVEATPQRGTTIVYDVTSPETITEAGFVKYVTHTDSTENSREVAAVKETPTSDMRLNFKLNITPDASMKLLMDHRTGDYINIEGNAQIIANYYNKGKFQMYGTYRVERGIYKLSMQDVIHKDFNFLPGGTIVFGGDAYQAGLNLKAAYTVPNVSLEDLSSTSLGLSNTRVDCIMNITGMPKQPIVTFDYDLPNANEDEKLMVRSMIDTEEERNMQVIYLLGIGRFYNVNMDAAGTGSKQTSMAMNSLLSSTLSSRFNQLLSSAIGGKGNWSFGTNLRTGEDGWSQLDVEGMLSGRLLNNRLLLNGNFGYRESLYRNNNNFIGDFDIQYVLNKARTISLKAYNQTNDRYFIQSSLTTQGIGLMFQKDFNKWKELFRNKKRQKK